MKLTLGFSPCPNDTFIFHALVHGLVDANGLQYDPRLEDVETLNRRALRTELDVSKVSYGALPYLLDRYTLLRSGGALGKGCGPLVVAREPMSRERLRRSTVAIPGLLTTANLLLRLFDTEIPPGIAMPYDRIMEAVRTGEADAGLIIHESRFTYPEHGLVEIVDLGAWWEETSGGPIPLGGIVARRDLGAEAIASIERGVRASVEYAFENPGASASYVADHAQEMSGDVIRDHIELYVNSYSTDMGAAGTAAVDDLLGRATAAGLLSELRRDPFPASTTI